MKKCEIIGGGDTGRGETTYTTKEIDEEIDEETEKQKKGKIKYEKIN